MTLSHLQWSRADGTYVGIVAGLPYHIQPGDPYWDEATGLAAASPPPPEPMPDAPPPSASDILAERARRLALGFDYDFEDARGVHRIGTTPADMAGWDEVTKLALARHATGSTTPIGIVTDTSPVQVTPAEWLAILEAANDFRQPIWHASFALQAMDPIPEDFAADHWWE